MPAAAPAASPAAPATDVPRHVADLSDIQRCADSKKDDVMDRTSGCRSELTPRKCRLLTFTAPMGAVWHLAELIWAPGGVCPTPRIGYTYGPSGPLPATP